MSLNKSVYGSEAPSRARRWAIHSLLVGLVILVFGFFQIFVVSPIWDEISLWIAGSAATAFVSWFMWQMYAGTGRLSRLKTMGRLMRGLTWVALPLVSFTIAYAWLAISLPAAVTALGFPSNEVSVVAQMEKSTSSSRRGCGFRLEGSLFPQGRSTKLCPSESFYNALPERPTLEVFGKENVFGFLVERYRLVEAIELSQAN